MRTCSAWPVATARWARSPQVAIERDLPFVCVPWGTRNHFANDVGLETDDPLAALAAFRDGVERRVDVGRVGDQMFLNNVSLGVYARLVHRRERRRQRGETFARLRALAHLAEGPAPQRALRRRRPAAASERRARGQQRVPPRSLLDRRARSGGRGHARDLRGARPPSPPLDGAQDPVRPNRDVAQPGPSRRRR